MMGNDPFIDDVPWENHRKMMENDGGAPVSVHAKLVPISSMNLGLMNGDEWRLYQYRTRGIIDQQT